MSPTFKRLLGLRETARGRPRAVAGGSAGPPPLTSPAPVAQPDPTQADTPPPPPAAQTVGSLARSADHGPAPVTGRMLAPAAPGTTPKFGAPSAPPPKAEPHDQGRGPAPQAPDAVPDPEPVRSSPATESEHADALADILAAGSVRVVFQPVVDLSTREVVGFEALSRGPAGSPLERPDLLFAAAGRAGRLAELDWACRAAAFSAALDADFRGALTLFVNVEPETFWAPTPPHYLDLRAEAERRLNIMLEITEEALTSRPAELVSCVERLRERGCGIALDDVGADVRSLALMPFLRPEVIKLDLRLVHEHPTMEVAEIVNAIWAQRERTSAAVLAEGIETEAHLETAVALGATFGQGWLFGRPAELPSVLPAPEMELFLPEASPSPRHTTPYEVVASVRATRPALEPLLTAISMQLEHQAAALGEEAVVLSCFQTAERFTPATQVRYASLASRAAFVAALGLGLSPAPAEGVRGASISGEDPLREEWSVVVIGPHFAAALVARDLGDSGPRHERRFDFALTYERRLAVDAAASLMARVRPLEKREESERAAA